MADHLFPATRQDLRREFQLWLLIGAILIASFAAATLWPRIAAAAASPVAADAIDEQPGDGVEAAAVALQTFVDVDRFRFQPAPIARSSLSLDPASGYDEIRFIEENTILPAAERETWIDYEEMVFLEQNSLLPDQELIVATSVVEMQFWEQNTILPTARASERIDFDQIVFIEANIDDLERPAIHLLPHASEGGTDY